MGALGFKYVWRGMAALIGAALIAAALPPSSQALQQEQEQATLTGIVWLDTNDDGIRQADEPLVPGVDVEVFEQFTVEGTRTTTDSQGQWTFIGPPGSYQVLLFVAGGVFTSPGQGEDPTVDSDVSPVGSVSGVSAVAGTTTVLDGGLRPAGIVEIRTWRDLDGNGVRTTGEPNGPKLGGSLSSVSDPSLVIETTPLVQSTFPRVGFGEWVLTLDPLAAYTLSPANVGDSEGTDSDVDPVTRQTTVTVSGASLVTTVTVGLIPDDRSLIVTPYEDLNLNGLRDAGEPVLPVDLALFDSADTLIAAGTPQPDGTVQFTAVPTTYRLELGDADLAASLRFYRDAAAARSIEVTVTNAEVTAVDIAITRVRPITLSRDTAGAAVLVYGAATSGTDLTVDTPLLIDALTSSTNTYQVRTRTGVQVTGIDCGQVGSSFITTSPMRSQWLIDLTGTAGGVAIDCVVRTVQPDLAKLVVIGRRSLVFSSEFGSPFDDLEIDPPFAPVLRDLNPGTYTTTIWPFSDLRQPALFCIDADVSSSGGNEFVLDIAPGSTPTCFANIVEAPDRWFGLRNGNDTDVVIPHTGESRAPSLTVGEPPSTAIPLEANEFVDWSAAAGVVAQLNLAPGEEFDSLDCQGATTLTTEISFSSATGGSVVAIEGTIDDPAAICTFTTTQRVFGDVNCDGEVSILDVSIIVQYVVGSRPLNKSCPTEPGAGQINLGTADTNDDQIVNILDAFRVVQCVVQLPNSLCPQPAA